MPIDLSTVDLDQPAFTSEGVTENPTADAPQAKSGEEGKPTSGGEPVAPVVEQQVPYSRFSETVKARREAEERAKEAEERYQLLLQQREENERNQPQSAPSDLPSWWVKMYGDNENSREAYKYELERQQLVKSEARREALEAVRQERSQESEILSRNEQTIDNRLADLSYGLGRDLSEQEEAAILDIVDEFTPKDEQGRYSGDLIPMNKAWEILQYRVSQHSQRQQESRKTPTELTSARTQGEPNDKAKNDKDFNPRDWNAYKRRLPK